MTATISVSIGRLILPLFGVQGIEVLVNGQPAAEGTFGETVTVDVPPGAYQVALRLRSVVSRTSNTVATELGEGQQVNLVGKYSRLWGSFTLKMG